MIKRVSTKCLAALLTVCLLVSMAAVGAVGASAATIDSASVGNAIAEKVVEQMIDDGLRAICLGMDAVGEATGNGDVQKVFSVIEEWAFMSTEEVAIEELKELCEEILNEIKELEAQIASDDAYITSMLADKNLSDAKTDLDNAWQSDVKNYLTDASAVNALSAYRDYLTDAVNGASEDTLRDDINYLIKQFALMSSASIDTSSYTIDNLKKMMFETNDINKSFITLISNLAGALSPHGTANTTCAEYAAQVAYMAYPFSHQQYAYVHEIAEEQLMTILMVEMAYNEYLYQQGQYLSETYHDEDEPNGWYAGYLSYQQDFYDEMNRGSDCVNSRIEKMLEAKMNADGDGFVMLSFSDYMKPEDAVTTTLHINGYQSEVDVLKEWADKCKGDYDYFLDATDGDGSEISKAQFIKENVKFRKVMTHTPAGSRVYYLLDPEQFKGTDALYVKSLDHNVVFHGLGSDTHTESCDYLNLCREMFDGANTFVGITDKECTGFSDLLATNYFSIRDSKIESYLSGMGNYLPDVHTNPNKDGGAPHNFVLSSSYSLESNAFATNYAKIKLVDCERQFPDAKPVADYEMDMEHGHTSVNECYTVFLRNKSDVFSQIAHAEVSNPAAGTISVTADGVHYFGNGESAMAAAGTDMTIRMKANGCKMTALKMIRNADSVSGTAQKTEELLLDETQLAGYTPDADGFITVHFTMPYSDVTYRLEIDDTVATATIAYNDGGTAAFADGTTEQYCKIGEKTLVYVACDSGYALHSIYLEDAQGNMLNDAPVTLDLSEKRADDEDAYSFTMPSQAVTVRAYFTAGNTVSLDTDSFQYNDNGDKLTYLAFIDDPDAVSRTYAQGFRVEFKAVCDPSYADNLAVTARGVTSGKDYALSNENDVYSFDLEKEDVILSISFDPHTFVNGFCTECGLYEKPLLGENGYYQITNAGNLFWISALTRDDHTHAIFDGRNLGPKFELVNDIDLESRQWEPIATSDVDYEFSGVFEGNGHTIDNYYFHLDVAHPNASTRYYGMFIGCDGARIQNFTIKGKAEIVCDLPEGEYLDDIYMLHFATIAGGQCYETHFSDIFSYVDITVENDLPAMEIFASGIANNISVEGSIVRCVNFGNITGDLYAAAGIINSTVSPSVNIKDCANLGTLQSSKDPVFLPDVVIDGIVYLVWDSIFFSEWCYLNINNCYNYGQLGNVNDAITDNKVDCLTINNCYYLEGSAADLYGKHTAHTAAQFKSGETGYLLNSGVTDGSQAWYQNIDNGKTPDAYPLPDKTRGTIYYIEGENRYSNYPDGNAPEPEIKEHGIRTYEELVEFANTVNAGSSRDIAYLENNIIVTADDPVWTDGIGTESSPFNGTFDGKGYYISGLRVDNAKDGGLFGTIGTDGVVRDLSVFDCDFKTVSENAGGIAAVNYGTIDHCTSGVNLSGKIRINGKTIDDVNAFNSYIRGNNAGGVAAVNYGTITGCRNGAVVEGGSAGGVTAVNAGEVYGSANNGMAGSTENSCKLAGGIAGSNRGAIASSYDSGKPVCKDKTAKGMIAGDNQSDRITDVFYTNVDGNTPIGSASGHQLPDEAGLVSTKTMQSDAFVDTLNGVTDDAVTWTRAQYGATSINQGYPIIQGRYLTQRTLTAPNGMTVSGMMHKDLHIKLEQLAAETEDYQALAAKGRLLAAYSFDTIDESGNFAPSELWSAGGYTLRIPTDGRSLALVAQNTEGEVVTITPDSVENGSAVFTVADVNSLAVAELPTVMIGDVNRDGKVDIEDATLIQKYAIDLPVGDFDTNAADVNGDGRISILDTTCVQKYAAEFSAGTGNAGQIVVLA